MPLSRIQLIQAATTSPWTKDFRHLQSFPRHWLRRTTIRDPRIKAAAAKDRIKYWNIVPGDQIRVRGDPKSTVHEVLSINRFSNRVFLKGITNETDEQSTGRMPPSKNVHYSRCELYIGNYEFPPKKGGELPVPKPVFARRLGTTKPYWQPMGCRWEWERMAVKTTPALPVGYEKERIFIPWPRPEKRSIPQPGVYDTKQEDVVAITYKPPSIPVSLKSPTPRPPPASAYLKSLLNPKSSHLEPNQPFEIHLHEELSNPHSRAKKQARWQAYNVYKKSLLLDYIKSEVKDLKGRTSREAKAEAVWKWRQRLEDEKKTEKKRRWKNRGSEARMMRKKTRQARKETKQRERLTAMVLQEEPNQVIPKIRA